MSRVFVILVPVLAGCINPRNDNTPDATPADAQTSPEAATTTSPEEVGPLRMADGGPQAPIPLATLPLTVSTEGTGHGRVRTEPGMRSCDGVCSYQLAPGTAVTLTAEAVAPSMFAGWSGDCTGTGPCHLVIGAARRATATFKAAGAVLWRAALENVVHVIERDGKVYAAGSVEGPLDGTPVHMGRRDVYLARFDLASGQREWIRRLPGMVDATIRGEVAVAFDPEGQVLLTGHHYYPVDFGGMTVSPSPDRLFAARYATRDGLLVGVRADLGGSWAASNGERMVVGDLGSYWTFVAGFDAATRGPPVEVSGPVALAGALTSGGDLVLGGRFTGTLAFGPTLLHTTGDNDDDGFVGRLARGTRPLWAVNVAGNRSTDVTSVTLDRRGDVVVAGTLQGSAVIGGNTLLNQGGPDLFVARLAGGSGATIWARVFGTSAAEWGREAVVTPEGDVYAVATMPGPVVIDGLGASGGGFVVKVAGGDGATVQLLGVEDSPQALALTSAGYLVIGGRSSLAVIDPR